VNSSCRAENVVSAWKDHESLKAYFTAQPEGTLEIALSFDILNRGEHIGFDNEAGTIKDNHALTDFQDDTYSLFNGTAQGLQTGLVEALAQIQTGDYIFMNLGATGVSHGFLIVGWGPAVECPSGLNSPQASDEDEYDDAATLGKYWTEKKENSVPYVVDFGYSYNTTEGKTGWLQDPRPRPFYCSAATMSDSNTDELSTEIQERIGFLNDLNGYFSRLKGAYRPYLRTDSLKPAWTFVHLPDRVQATYGTLLSCS
jgi:hypothetical protein